MPLIRREQTAEATPAADNSESCARLTEQLCAVEGAVRRAAARALAAHPGSIGALCERLPQESEAAVREAIFDSLLEIGGGEVAAALAPLLRSERADLRNGALEVLAGLPEASLAVIDTLLDDPDADVRILSVTLLGMVRHPGVAARLARVAAEERELNVCAAAIDAIHQLGGPEQLPLVARIEERFSADPFIAFIAGEARRRLGGASG